MTGINDLLAMIRKIAIEEVQRYSQPVKVGYVTSFDPDNYAVRVRLEPESTANERAV